MKDLNKLICSIGLALILFWLIPAGGAAACGNHWELACWSWDCWCLRDCNDRNNNILGLCTPCGAWGEMACWSGPACDWGYDNVLGWCYPSCGPWHNNLGLLGCADCGDSWQGMCLAGAPCKDRNNNAGLCTPCGAHWEVACWSAPACDDRNNKINILGIDTCTPCGATGELACLSGRACDTGNRIVAGFCSFSGYSQEPTTNVAELPDQRQAGSGSDPVRGIADLHVHQFSNLAFGGVMFWGSPFDWGGINSALPWCDYTWDFATKFLSVPLPPSPLGYEVHGPKGPTQIVSAPVSTFQDAHCDRNPLACIEGHAVGGTGPFDGWPMYDSSTHQQMYHTWVKRAYEGGVRLMVMLAINSEALCMSQKQRAGWDCDDMKAVDRQLQATKDLEWAIDYLDDGRINGSGWYRIAYSPQQARQIIRNGKMAVVLGIEVDSLFGCKFGVNCTREYLQGQLKKYYDFGVRHIYPIHHYDNAFGGSAIFMNLLNIGSVFITGHQPRVSDCSRNDCELSENSYLDPEGKGTCGYSYNIGKPDFLSALIVPLTEVLSSIFGNSEPVDQSYYDQFAADCNEFGLFPKGRELIEDMMEQKFIIDTDHMSRLMVDEVLEMARNRNPKYPLVSSHSSFRDLTPTPEYCKPDDPPVIKTEFSVTDKQMEIFKEIGGMVTAINPKGRCGTSADYMEVLNHAVDRMKKDDNDAYPGVAFSTDFQGFAEATGPRFCPECRGEANEKLADENTRLTYPFDGPFGGKFDKQVTGQRWFDYNTQGMAHYGLIPDFFADLKAQGVTDKKLEPLYNSAEAYIRMWETIDNSDKMPPPLITPNITGQVGNNGWYTSDVTVGWDIVPEDGLVSRQGCDTTVISTDTTGVTLTCRAATEGGESAVSVIVKIDKTPPTYTARRSPEVTWTNQAVRVTFEATDATSGLAGPATAEVIVDLEGAGLTARYTFTDQAGLTMNAVLEGINIDRTPPNVGFVFAYPVVIDTPEALNAELQRWHNADVVFNVLATDPLSGVATLSANQLTLGAEGPAVGGSVTAVDNAGNSITVSSPLIKIDKTPPTIQFLSRTPAPNVNGWNNSDVTVRWACSDALSGVILSEVSQTVSSEGANQSAEGTCTDLAGNTASHTVTGINIDKMPPQITGISANPSVLWPPNHKMIDVAINYTATDTYGQPVCNISGITSNEPISNSGYLIVDAHRVKLRADRLGNGSGRIYTITVTCTDASGNSSIQTVTVIVPHDQGKK